MKPQPMSEAPRDGTRVLLHHHVKHYRRPTKEQLDAAGLKGGMRRMAAHYADWYRDGTVWEECWFERAETGNRGMGRNAWTPWCGNSRTWSTDTISEEDCIAWMPVPKEVHES